MGRWQRSDEIQMNVSEAIGGHRDKLCRRANMADNLRFLAGYASRCPGFDITSLVRPEKTILHQPDRGFNAGVSEFVELAVRRRRSSSGTRGRGAVLENSQITNLSQSGNFTLPILTLSLR